MIHIIPQSRAEWHLERLPRLTASKFDEVITSQGKLSKSEKCRKVIDKIIAGTEFRNRVIDGRINIDGLEEWQLIKRIADFTGDSFTGNQHTERGNLLEDLALMEMSDKIGIEISPGGICIMGDDRAGIVSASPDGLVQGLVGPIAGCEVKAPCLSTFISWVAAGVLPDEHKIQVHGSMAVTGLDTWHFGAYFDGMPLFYLKVERDDFTKQIDASLREFSRMAVDRAKEYRKKLETL